LTPAPVPGSLADVTDEYSGSTYGDRIADVYDARYAESFAEDTGQAIAFLKELASGRHVLELGVGTGRVAIPLAESGLEVHGIDASEAMLDKMRAKPGGDRVRTTVGSFADFSLPTKFGVIYVVFDTFFGLLTQEEQVSCFRAVARHLEEDGVFVMQAFVPDVTRFDVHNQRVSVESVGVDEVTIEASTHDPFAQRTDSAYVAIREGHVQTYPVRIRYAYPSELDLMARLAGLTLRERWANWDRQVYPSHSWTHISSWEREARS
jgi:SAM-dependent methyltransferase